MLPASVNSSELRRPFLSTSQGAQPWSIATARTGLFDFAAAARAWSGSVSQSPAGSASAGATRSSRKTGVVSRGRFIPKILAARPLNAHP